MELGELLALRPQPGAGLLVCLTRRCPLRCAHCSTGSGPTEAEQPGAEALLRFVAGFTAQNRPDVMLLTGGEPLLRPALAARLATLARAAGTRTALLSGMWFAREDGRVPAAILRAAALLDHFSASLDAHHEREVPRAATFAALRRIRDDAGVPVSFHVTGSGPTDPYLADATAAIRREFGPATAVLVNEVRPFGRAASWASSRATTLVRAGVGGADGVRGSGRGAGVGARAGELAPRDVNLAARAGDAVPEAGERGLAPCAMAAWPVIGFDGTVLACCNEHTVDRRPVPAHLRLGHIAEDDWAAVRLRATSSPVLRAIRTLGPTRLSPGRAPTAPGSYCATCRALPADPAALATAERVGGGLVGAILDREAARAQSRGGARALARRYACAPYAHLVDPPDGDEGRPVRGERVPAQSRARHTAPATPAYGSPAGPAKGTAPATPAYGSSAAPAKGAAPAARLRSPALTLRTKLDLARPALATACSALWRSPVTPARYVAYLTAMHGVIRASVPLMERAAALCASEEWAGDPICGPLGAHLAAHVVEERGHDEWLLEDLAVAGADAAALTGAVPAAEVAALAGSAYYWVEHHHPAVLLGYIAALESNAPAPWLAARLAADTGLPSGAFRTLREHADLDGGHTLALEALLDALPLGPALEEAVGVCALHTTDGLIRLFTRLAGTESRR